jgi:RNA polymerase sigma-70 factor (ECF subfamily)
LIQRKFKFTAAVLSWRRHTSWSGAMTPTSLSKTLRAASAKPPWHGGLEADVCGSERIRGLVEHRLLLERTRHLRYLQTKLRCREDAEDALQDFTIRAIQGAGRVREDRIDAWLNVSLRNALFDRYRRESSRRRLNDAAAVEPTDVAEPALIEDVSSGCLSISMAELKPSYSTVLRRADFEEASLGDLARELGLTTNNTAVRLHRARAVLRRVMHLRCTACPTPCLLAAHFIARAAA